MRHNHRGPLGGSLNRFPAGTPVTVSRVCGHRDGDATSCPGDALYGQLDDLRARAALHAGPISAITVHAASQQGTKPTSLSGVQTGLNTDSAMVGSRQDMLTTRGGPCR